MKYVTRSYPYVTRIWGVRGVTKCVRFTGFFSCIFILTPLFTPFLLLTISPYIAIKGDAWARMPARTRVRKTGVLGV